MGNIWHNVSLTNFHCHKPVGSDYTIGVVKYVLKFVWAELTLAVTNWLLIRQRSCAGCRMNGKWLPHGNITTERPWCCTRFGGQFPLTDHVCLIKHQVGHSRCISTHYPGQYMSVQPRAPVDLLWGRKSWYTLIRWLNGLQSQSRIFLEWNHATCFSLARISFRYK